MKSQFVSDSMCTIAQIHFNDWGLQQSGRMTQQYLEKAQQYIEDIRNPLVRRELLAVITKISRDCKYLLEYTDRVSNFKNKKTKWVIELVSKQTIILKSNGDLSFIHAWLSHQLRTFHTQISSILLQSQRDISRKVENRRV